MSTLLPRKPDPLREIFTEPKPIIGMIHLAPLPGAPRYDGQPVEEIYAAGVADALAMSEAGIDGIIVENAFDLPFARPEAIGPETVAALSAACLRVREAVDLPIGITCVANGVIPALAIAKAVGARFIRANQWVNAYVANEGFINGPAGEALRYRSAIGAQQVRVFADVHVKFGAHAITGDRTISEQARDAEFFDADLLIASGQRTGSPTDASEVRAIRAGTSLPVIVGSGLDVHNAAELLSVADGAIVGSSLKVGGKWWNPVDPIVTKELMEVVRGVRNRTKTSN